LEAVSEASRAVRRARRVRRIADRRAATMLQAARHDVMMWRAVLHAATLRLALRRDAKAALYKILRKSRLRVSALSRSRSSAEAVNSPNHLPKGSRFRSGRLTRSSGPGETTRPDERPAPHHRRCPLRRRRAPDATCYRNRRTGWGGQEHFGGTPCSPFRISQSGNRRDVPSACS